MILNEGRREGKRLRWLWKCWFWKDNIAKQCHHTLDYCIRSCSSLVSLRGVIKNHMTCIKAFYFLHYIFFALAQVWRAELCSWPPAPWPSTALSRDDPGCFPRTFSADQGRTLLRPWPWLLLLGLATLSPTGAKALQSLLTRTITVTCPCPSLVNVCVCKSYPLHARCSDACQIRQHWVAWSSWLVPSPLQHGAQLLCCACKGGARSLPGSWLEAVLGTSSSSRPPYHLKKKLPSAKLFSNPPHAIQR